MRHTPGPWKVKTYGSDGIEIVADYSDQFPILCNTTQGISFHAKADAQLMACSPELLEALIKCRLALGQLADSPVHYYLELADKIIEKAKQV